MKDAIEEVEKDFAILARLAAAQSHEDVRLLLARLVRKYRQHNPELAALLDQSLKATQTRSSGGSILRRDTSQIDAPLPIDRDSRLALIKQFDDRGGLEAPLLSASLKRQLEAVDPRRHLRVP